MREFLAVFVDKKFIVVVIITAAVLAVGFVLASFPSPSDSGETSYRTDVPTQGN